jgi:hypothetical protein
MEATIEGTAAIKPQELTYSVSVEKRKNSVFLILINRSDGVTFSNLIKTHPFVQMIEPNQAFEHFKAHFKEYAIDC